MGKMIEVRWHGRGGQGSFTASKLLGEAVALHGGKHALAFPSFGPERRGAPVLAFTKIDNEKIQDRSEVRKCNYIVVLDETLFNETFFQDLKPEGIIVLNAENPDKYKAFDPDKIHLIDASGLAQTLLGKPITNTAMLGALAAISGIVTLEALLATLESYMKGGILEKNRQIIKTIYEKFVILNSI